MSTEKKPPLIQFAPVQPFTVRLVDGHFVRVPKLENTAATDATRPPTKPTEADGVLYPRRMRLVNGRFRDVTALETPAEDAPPAAAAPPQPRPVPAPEKERPAESWSFPFSTRLAPSDPPDKT